MPVGQDAPQFVPNGSLSLTPVPPIPQYPAGFLSGYCWCQCSIAKDAWAAYVSRFAKRSHGSRYMLRGE